MESHLYAPFWSRLLAHNIDLVLFIPIGYGISGLVERDLVLYGILSITYIMYNTLLEATTWQGSLGKKLLSMKVTPTKGERLIWWKCLLRNGLKFLSLGLLFTGFLMIRFNMKRQGLHDWLSGSVVISA